MPSATPVRVPGRRPRGSLNGADDVSHLSLAEVRDRLARNERVLSSALFSTSPSASRGIGMAVSPTGAAGSSAAPTNANPLGATSTSTSPSAGGEDPMRERLLAVRESLLAREQELMAEKVGSMSLTDSGPLATSPPTRSGKARALESIRLGEANLAPNSLVLPISQSIALGERDFDNQTAQRFAMLGLSGRARDGTQFIDDDLGRSQAAARYARAHVDSDDDMFDTDEAYAANTVYASERADMGNGLPLTQIKVRRQEGFEDDMRNNHNDEDDSEFAEGNDEYEGNGSYTMDAGRA